MDNFILYALIDPRNNYVKYIGKTIYPLKRRLMGHISTAKNLKTPRKVTNWIKSLLKQNLEPKILELETYENHEDLIENEIFYISYFKFLTNNQLLNQTDGGEGVLGVKMSKETRDKLSKALTGKK